MKKITALCLLFTLACITAFANADDKEAGPLNIQMGMSFLYRQPFGNICSDSMYLFFNLHTGFTFDILFSLGGIIEIAAETGAFLGLANDPSVMSFIFDFPFDALLRLNFTKRPLLGA